MNNILKYNNNIQLFLQSQLVKRQKPTQYYSKQRQKHGSRWIGYDKQLQVWTELRFI